LIFSSTLFNGRTARELINERANQSTRNDPLRTREVKHGLSRSFPPLLWISRAAEIFFENFFRQRVARVVKKQTTELSPPYKKTLQPADYAGPVRCRSGFSPTPPTPVAHTVQPRKFAEKMPSRASIS
jgi:hypothetical protein